MKNLVKAYAAGHRPLSRPRAGVRGACLSQARCDLARPAADAEAHDEIWRGIIWTLPLLARPGEVILLSLLIAGNSARHVLEQLEIDQPRTVALATEPSNERGLVLIDASDEVGYHTGINLCRLTYSS